MQLVQISPSLLYQTHGQFVWLGSPMFKLIMNSMAQKTRAAELTLHSAYPMTSWLQ